MARTIGRASPSVPLRRRCVCNTSTLCASRVSRLTRTCARSKLWTVNTLFGNQTTVYLPYSSSSREHAYTYIYSRVQRSRSKWHRVEEPLTRPAIIAPRVRSALLTVQLRKKKKKKKLEFFFIVSNVDGLVRHILPIASRHAIRNSRCRWKSASEKAGRRKGEPAWT